MTTELEKLERQTSWDTHRRSLMADRVRLRHEAAMAGAEEPVWVVDPPLVVPAYWQRPEGQISVQRVTSAPPVPVVEEVVAGRNALGQVVRGHEPPKLLTAEQQFAVLEGRDQESRLRDISSRFSAVLRGKDPA